MFMSTNSHLHAKTYAALAILFILPPIVFFAIRSSVGIRYNDLSESAKRDTFLAHFPSFMQNITAIHVIALVCCIVSMVLASRSFKKKVVSIRILMMITVLVAIFLILFNVAKMM